MYHVWAMFSTTFNYKKYVLLVFLICPLEINYAWYHHFHILSFCLANTIIKLLGGELWLCVTIGNLIFWTCINLSLFPKISWYQLPSNILLADGVNFSIRNHTMKKSLPTLPNSEFLPLNWLVMMECHFLHHFTWDNTVHIYILCVHVVLYSFRQNGDGRAEVVASDHYWKMYHYAYQNSLSVFLFFVINIK